LGVLPDHSISEDARWGALLRGKLDDATIRDHRGRSLSPGVRTVVLFAQFRGFPI